MSGDPFDPFGATDPFESVHQEPQWEHRLNSTLEAELGTLQRRPVQLEQRQAPPVSSGRPPTALIAAALILIAAIGSTAYLILDRPSDPIDSIVVATESERESDAQPAVISDPAAVVTPVETESAEIVTAIEVPTTAPSPQASAAADIANDPGCELPIPEPPLGLANVEFLGTPRYSALTEPRLDAPIVEALTRDFVASIQVLDCAIIDDPTSGRAGFWYQIVDPTDRLLWVNANYLVSDRPFVSLHPSVWEQCVLGPDDTETTREAIVGALEKANYVRSLTARTNVEPGCVAIDVELGATADFVPQQFNASRLDRIVFLPGTGFDRLILPRWFDHVNVGEGALVVADTDATASRWFAAVTRGSGGGGEAVTVPAGYSSDVRIDEATGRITLFYVDSLIDPNPVEWSDLMVRNPDTGAIRGGVILSSNYLVADDPGTHRVGGLATSIDGRLTVRVVDANGTVDPSVAFVSFDSFSIDSDGSATISVGESSSIWTEFLIDVTPSLAGPLWVEFNTCGGCGSWQRQPLSD